MLGDGGNDRRLTIVDLSAVGGFTAVGAVGIGEGVGVVSARAANLFAESSRLS